VRRSASRSAIRRDSIGSFCFLLSLDHSIQFLPTGLVPVVVSLLEAAGSGGSAFPGERDGGTLQDQKGRDSNKSDGVCYDLALIFIYCQLSRLSLPETRDKRPVRELNLAHFSPVTIRNQDHRPSHDRKHGGLAVSFRADEQFLAGRSYVPLSEQAKHKEAGNYPASLCL